MENLEPRIDVICFTEVLVLDFTGRVALELVKVTFLEKGPAKKRCGKPKSWSLSGVSLPGLPLRVPKRVSEVAKCGMG